MIFSSLNIGKKIRLFLKILDKNKFNIFWWYFDTANANKKRFNDVKKIAKHVTLFFNRDKINFPLYKKLNIVPIWLDQAVPHILKVNKKKCIAQYDIGFFSK